MLGKARLAFFPFQIFGFTGLCEIGCETEKERTSAPFDMRAMCLR